MPGFGMSTSLRINRNSQEGSAIGPSGLMFHHFHGGRHLSDGQGSLSGGDLEKILLSIGLKNILNPQTWFERMHSGQLKPSDRCLTFDDGLLSQYDVALPILNKFSLKAFWFIYSAPFEGEQCFFEIIRKFRNKHFANFQNYFEVFLEEAKISLKSLAQDIQYNRFFKTYKSKFSFYKEEEIIYRFIRNHKLTKQQYLKICKNLLQKYKVNISELSMLIWMTNKHLQILATENHEVGLHSYDHPFHLGGLSKNQQLYQYKKNAQHLQSIGIRPRSAAHPCGSYSKETLNILNSLSINCGFKSDSATNNKRKFSHLVIPREDSACLKN